MDIKKEIIEANLKHTLDLTESDVYIFDSGFYINSQKAAKMLKASFHTFCNYYSKSITKSGLVKRATLGRNKYYLLSDLENILHQSIKTGKTIFVLCNEEIASSKKKKVKVL